MYTSQPQLTRREHEVAQLISEGLTSREIGKKLFIEERSVEGHVQNILNKLGFRRRAQIAAWIAERQVTPVATPDQTEQRHNLPLRLTSFVGRTKEIADLEALLPESRLLTLTGPGGVGKTRLALKLAEQVVEQYPDGVWLVELAPIAETKLVVQELATTVGVRETPGRALLEIVIHRLSNWHALVILDNCEHVVGAAANLSHQLLTSCPQLRILTTSREPLRVAGEIAYPVPPLALPDDPQAMTLEALAGSEAIRLFVDRGRIAASDFALSAGNARPVTAICRALDGLPLAIELAAARLPLMSPEEILQRLDRRFQILTGGSRIAMPRQQTLAATMDWSYELLSEDERTLLQRLTVFNGGFTADAVEKVCSGDGLTEDGVLPLLLQLVERSLVSPQHLDDGRTRYQLLETIRQYGLERLGRTPGAESVDRRHAAYFQSLADQRMRDNRAGKRGWALALEEDIDNLRSAFDWALKISPGTALRLTATLSLFWWMRGHFAEGLDRATSALEACPEKTLLRARALAESANFFCRSGRSSQGKINVDEAVAIARAIGHGPDVSWILARCGMVATESLEELDYANELFAEALEFFQPTGDQAEDRHQLGAVYCWFGWLTYVRGDFNLAIELSRRSLAVFDGGRAHPGFHVVALDTLAWARHDMGDLAAARTHWQEEITLARDIGYSPSVSGGLHGLAAIEAAESRPSRALRLFGVGDKIRSAHGSAESPWAIRKLAPLRDRARQDLGDAAANLAYEEGRRMSADDAVALALSSSEPDKTKSKNHRKASTKTRT